MAGGVKGEPGIPEASVPGFAENAFANYREELHRFLLRRLRNTQDANDLVQEVFLRVLQLERTETLRNPQAYLYGIASHVAHEFRHRAMRERVTYDSEAAEHRAAKPAYIAVDELGESIGMKREIEQALAELPAVQLRILIARQSEGLSYPQIAQSLGLSTHTVRKYLDRALASVRRRLALERPRNSTQERP